MAIVDLEVLDDERRGRKPTEFYQLHGRRVTIEQLADIADMSTEGMWYRLKVRGMSPETAIAVPKKCTSYFHIGSEYLSCRQITERLHYHHSTFYRRARANGTTVQEELDKEWRRQHE